MPPSIRGIVEKLKGTKRIYLHYARNQCPNKGNAVIERENQLNKSMSDNWWKMQNQTMHQSYTKAVVLIIFQELTFWSSDIYNFNFRMHGTLD